MTSSETLGIVLMPETHHGSPVFSFGFPSVVLGLSFSTKRRPDPSITRTARSLDKGFHDLNVCCLLGRIEGTVD